MAMVGERLCLFVSVVLFPRISFRIESYLKEEMEGRADLGRGPSPTRQTGRQPRHLRRRSFVFLFFFFFLFFACVLYRRNRNRSRSIQTVERAMECIILRVFFYFCDCADCCCCCCCWECCACQKVRPSAFLFHFSGPSMWSMSPPGVLRREKYPVNENKNKNPKLKSK